MSAPDNLAGALCSFLSGVFLSGHCLLLRLARANQVAPACKPTCCLHWLGSQCPYRQKSLFVRFAIHRVLFLRFCRRITFAARLCSAEVRAFANPPVLCLAEGIFPIACFQQCDVVSLQTLPKPRRPCSLFSFFEPRFSFTDSLSSSMAESQAASRRSSPSPSPLATVSAACPRALNLHSCTP